MMNAFVENVKRKIKLPATTEKKKSKTKKIRKEHESAVPGVVYVGHIPRGFYGKEMRAYFSQFGDINRLRVARSSRTGGYKGYAFIEFKSEEVAKIVAETMNNYLFFEKLLQCQFIPKDKVHPNTFNAWRPYKPLRSDINRDLNNKEKDEKQVENSKNKRIQRLNKLRASLKESGINFKIKPFLPKEDEDKKPKENEDEKPKDIKKKKKKKNSSV